MVSHCCVWTPNIVPSTVTTLRFVNLYFIPAGLQCSNGMPWPLVSWTLDDLGTIRARRCDTHLVLPTSRKHHGVCMNFLWNYGIRVWYINIWGIWMGSMLPYIAAPWIRHGYVNHPMLSQVLGELFLPWFQQNWTGGWGLTQGHHVTDVTAVADTTGPWKTWPACMAAMWLGLKNENGSFHVGPKATNLEFWRVFFWVCITRMNYNYIIDVHYRW